jgi:hypothetical protein
MVVVAGTDTSCVVDCYHRSCGIDIIRQMCTERQLMTGHILDVGINNPGNLLTLDQPLRGGLDNAPRTPTVEGCWAALELPLQCVWHEIDTE